MENELKVVGRRLKLLRMEHNVSQTDLAKGIGMSQTNLSNIEAGRTAVTIQNLIRIRELLGCKMSDFFVDFDAEEEASQKEKGAVKGKRAAVGSKAISIEEAVQILRLLKAVEIKDV
ncbi:MAG: helix-turn-helix transcriptional regulator [Phascolarctobacterium sp.]|nr:helix-turn-helix transcriptional regulator [Phascolarctobacterium sp.]